MNWQLCQWPLVSRGRAATSPGSQLLNPLIQVFGVELYTRAPVHKLGCLGEAPGERFRTFHPSPSPSPGQLKQNLPGWGLGMSVLEKLPRRF